MKTAPILALLLGASAMSATAQDPTADLTGGSGSKIVFTRTDDATREILNRHRPVENKAIPAPTFALKTQNNKFIMTIGGSINLVYGYDIGNNLYQQPGAGISFVTSAIPVPSVKGHRSDYYINPFNSAVDMQIVGLANTDNEISAYVKLGTDGNSMNLMLLRAYMTWRNFTFGEKLTLLQDCYACQPPTIDPEGPSGCVSNVAYEISYTSPSYNGFRYAVGLDMPTYYSSNGIYRGKDFPRFDGTQVANYRNAEQIIPDVPAWIEYSFSQWNRIRLSGILRTFSYVDNVADKTRHLAAWGAMLSGNLSPCDSFIFYYQFAYGKGIGNYIQDIAGKPISFIPRDDRPGRMKASPMMGLNAGVTFNATKKLQFNAMFSEARIWDVEDYCNALPSGENYKYALYAAANCFYNITPYLQCGVEYLWGHRQTWNQGGAHDNRIQAQLQFTF